MCSTPPLILPSLLPFPPPLYIPTIRCNEQPRVWQQLNASNSVRGASWSRNVQRAAKGVAAVKFFELCEVPLGAADYFALCKNFHTIAMEGIPIFGASNRGAAYRFVTLIDVSEHY
ncbi:unnamed protein product [Closterium sp. NIES-54]